MLGKYFPAKPLTIADAISPPADCNNGGSIYKSPLDHSAAKHREGPSGRRKSDL